MAPLAVPPSLHTAVVTCMDSRIDVFALFTMDIGETHVLRNAGGVVTDDVIRSLAISQRMLGTRDVLLVRILNEPGTLGEVALVMARAGVNIDTVYVTMRGQVVLGVDDLAGATQVAGGMAVMAPE